MPPRGTWNDHCLPAASRSRCQSGTNAPVPGAGLALALVAPQRRLVAPQRRGTPRPWLSSAPRIRSSMRKFPRAGARFSTEGAHLVGKVCPVTARLICSNATKKIICHGASRIHVGRKPAQRHFVA